MSQMGVVSQFPHGLAAIRQTGFLCLLKPPKPSRRPYIFGCRPCNHGRIALTSFASVAMVVLMAASFSMHLPSYLQQNGSSKRRHSSASHNPTSSAHSPSRQPSSRKSSIKSRALSLHSLKSVLVDAYRPAQTGTEATINMSSNSNLAPPQPAAARPGNPRSESATSVKSALEHFTAPVRPSVSTRDSQAELPAPAHHLGVPARPPNTPRQPSADNLRSGLAGPVTDGYRGAE